MFMRGLGGPLWESLPHFENGEKKTPDRVNDQGKKNGLGEPFAGYGVGKETLMFQVAKPHPGKAFQFGLEGFIDMGRLAVVIVAVDLLIHAHIVIAK